MTPALIIPAEARPTRSDDKSGIRVKVCGLSHLSHLAAAAKAGATYAGFVFFPKSPRCVSAAQARELAFAAPAGLAKVGLFVDPSDELLDQVLAEVPLDMIQLHGSEEPARVSAVRSRFGLPIMKAVGVANAGDVEQISRYWQAADQILVDAKPPKDAALPGGNGLAFDWDLLRGLEWRRPWMLAGGLTVGNVAEAVTRTGARQVDVSSGVESAPGQKDPELISAFIRAAQA